LRRGGKKVCKRAHGIKKPSEKSGAGSGAVFVRSWWLAAQKLRGAN